MAKRGSDEWKAKISATLKGRHNNPAGEFKKGHTPWTTGMKGIHLSPATEFKLGHPGGNALQRWRPVQTIVVHTHRHARTRWIKIREDGPPGSHKYIPLARHLYATQIGPIPPGCFVVHRNGDSMDDRLDNLLLMDRKHLLAWQRSVRPTLEATRKRKAAESQRLRRRIYWAKKAAASVHDALRTA